MTPFGPLKSCGVRYSASHGYTFRRAGRTVMGPDRLLYGRGDKFKSLVANQDTEFKILTSWFYHKTAKFTISQLDYVTKTQIAV